MTRFFRMILAAAAATALAGACSSPDYASFVDPKIGSGAHGHVFVGANVPFGMVQLGPTNKTLGWDWCSGYHESDNSLIGFSHTHLSGTGCGDLLDVSVLPVIGEMREATMDKSTEIAHPGYYQVMIPESGVRAEVTTTSRVGFHRYTFPESAEAGLLFNLEHGGNKDRSVEGGFTVVDNCHVKGFRHSVGWANNQKLFFFAEFSKPFDSFEVDSLFGRAAFRTKDGEKVLLKVGISSVSEEGAEANLAAELPGWNFDKAARTARAAWNRELARIRVETPTDSLKTIFYTGMYHLMIHPSAHADVNGDYRGTDDVIHSGEGFNNYTVFSLWDTYRAALPLETIILPDRMDDFVNTMVHIYEQQGKLPVWHLMNCETNCMVGNPGAIAVADAIVKGYRGFDLEKAVEALQTSVNLDVRNQGLRKEYGYIPSDLARESIGFNMEYDIADAAVANALESLGRDSAARFHRERSRSSLAYWDPETRFFRGKTADGAFTGPFNPSKANHLKNEYTEGTAWQYLWLMPHNVDGLVSLFGSKEALIEKLDSFFVLDTPIEGESPDVTGIMGQYAHGNEPGHHTIYLYTMLGEPRKAADRLREVYRTMYSTRPDGLCGNEDEGQMSAWYILSSLGFYQVEPAVARYWFGAPLFEKAELQVAGGTFTVEAEDLSDEKPYIGSVTLNGAPYDLPYIRHEDIVRGGKLVFHMTD